MVYQWIHLVVGVVNMFFGVFGEFYALRALMALYRSPEVLKTQRAIWLPVLIGGAFFTVSVHYILLNTASFRVSFQLQKLLLYVTS